LNIMSFWPSLTTEKEIGINELNGSGVYESFR
jgi:hypothetical protein